MQQQFLVILGFPPLKLDKVNNFLRSRGVDFIRIPLYSVVVNMCQDRNSHHKKRKM